MKVKFLKKIAISAVFSLLVLSAQMLPKNMEKIAKTKPCPHQITVSAKENKEQKPKDSLKEIAKPYLGVYECEWLYFGGDNKKDAFEYLRIELKSKGELLVSYKLKKGEKGEVPLSYEYDFKEKTLRVFGQWQLLKIDRKFPLKNGELSVVMNLFGKLVNVKFSRK